LIGYGSDAINDQLVPVPPVAAYNPLVYGAMVDMWPAYGTYSTPPVLGASSPITGTADYSMPGQPEHGGSITMPTAVSPEGSPFSLKHSPLWWAIFGVVGSLLILHYVFWRD
jgi:hypothetical protein